MLLAGKKQDKISENFQFATTSSVYFAELKSDAAVVTENVSAAANLTPQSVSNSSSTSSYRLSLGSSSRSDASSNTSASSEGNEDILFDVTYEPPNGSNESTSADSPPPIISTSPSKKGRKEMKKNGTET
ncbi:hypothetical protein HHI36_015152 [Cryptolaemus montrouzieri]|uniref:Uncharacterized protein n=1 Tax=Cryptolaemus montrouzieri TaxID=559131 RepID=A0ABD2N4T7_9CUCU